MGNKTSASTPNEKEGGSSPLQVQHLPVSVHTPELKSCFGDSGTWRPLSTTAVLEMLYHIPCLVECILNSSINSACSESEKQCILALQHLFSSRAISPPSSIISCDRFFKLLKKVTKESNNLYNIYDDDDPTEIYCALSSFLMDALPPLRGIFLDHIIMQQKYPKGNTSAGNSGEDSSGKCSNTKYLSIPLQAAQTTHIETAIKDLVHNNNNNNNNSYKTTIQSHPRRPYLSYLLVHPTKLKIILIMVRRRIH